MSQLSETQIPPGGWQYLQPQTHWNMPNPVSVTLNQATDLLVAHRRANPQFNLPVSWVEVKHEILAYTRARLNLPEAPPLPPFQPQHPATAVGVADRVGKTAAGIGLVVDWLGAGLKTVEQHLADHRSAICATCPQNQKGDLLQRLEGYAAEKLRKTIEIKRDMKLESKHEKKLQVCQVCDCYLPLKVWTPLQHVLDNTKDSVKAQLDPRCWILKEKV